MTQHSQLIDLLVLSDRYPPFARGGAELSLHAMLREMARDRHVEVVSLCGERGKVHRYEHEGVFVTELPVQAEWPSVQHASNRLNRFVRQQKIARPLRRLLERRALSRSGLFDDPELAELRAVTRGRARLRGGISLDAQNFGDGYTRRQLRALFGTALVRHLHADNYRAICLADEIPSETRTHMVRDNRFTCPRFDQSRSVANRACTACDFDCATEDAPKAQRALRRILTANGEFRRHKLLQCDEIISTSRYMISTLDTYVPAARLSRVPNPIDDAGAVADTILGVPQRPGFHMVVIGMLNENKGQAQLLKAWAGHLRDNPDFHLHFAGRGVRIGKQLELLAAKFGIDRQITLHGYLDRERLYSLIAQSQLVLLPTVWAEPFGRVPLEAALVRRPVVAFSAGGLGETILDGKTGYLCDVGDYEALWQRVLTLADDPALCAEMGEAAHASATQDFAAHSIVSQLSGIWQRLRGGTKADQGEPTIAAE